jgi:hypothetical protein
MHAWGAMESAANVIGLYVYGLKCGPLSFVDHC